jgi:hypothetical protein
MSEPVDLSQRRAAQAEARANKLMAPRAYVDNVPECGAILADAIEQMWDAGADPSETCRHFAGLSKGLRQQTIAQTFKAASDEAQAGDTPG